MEEYYFACKGGDFDMVKKYVEKGVDINGLYERLSPFIFTCFNGHKEIVEYLIEKNVDVSLKDDAGYTALMMACWEGNTKIAELLLSHNSFPNFIRCQNDEGETALMCASQCGHEDAVRLLLFYDPSGEHIMIKNEYGKTAIDVAKTEKIRELLRSPAQLSVIETKRAKPSTG